MRRETFGTTLVAMASTADAMLRFIETAERIELVFGM